MAQQGTRALRQLDTDALFVLGGAHASLETFLTEQTLGAGERFSLVALPLLAAVPFVRRQRALGWWCLLLGGAALVLACGPETPFFRIYFALPGLSWFRTPSQLLLLTDFTLAMAAAIALDALWVQTTVADGRTGRVVSRLAVVAAAVALCVARCRWDATIRGA